MKTITLRSVIVIAFFSLTINLVINGRASSEPFLSVDLPGLTPLYNGYNWGNDFSGANLLPVLPEIVNSFESIGKINTETLAVDLPGLPPIDNDKFQWDQLEKWEQWSRVDEILQNLPDPLYVPSVEKDNKSESTESENPEKRPGSNLFGPSLEPGQLDFKANTYNVQFLTPEWFPLGKEVRDDHWPNSVRRAKEIAEHAIAKEIAEHEFDCIDFSLLQETINTHRRNEIVQRLNEVCTENDDGSSNGKYRYHSYSLRHHWNGLGDALKAAAGVLDYAFDEVTNVIDEVTDVISLGAADKLKEVAFDKLKEVARDVIDHVIDLPNDEIVDPTPISHEEISVITNLPVVEINELEFSVASGIDRLAAKGVLHVRLALGSEKKRPVSRKPPPVDYCDPTPNSSGNNTTYGDSPVSDPVNIYTFTGIKKCSDLDIESDDETISNGWGQDIDVFVTHLNANSAPHIDQIIELLGFIDLHWDRELPMVLAGDFNTRLDSPNFQLLCSGLESLPFKDIVGEINGRCDNLKDESSDLEYLTFARIGATNKEGWRWKPTFSNTPGQIDHVFTMGLTTNPKFARNFNKLPHPQDKIAVWNHGPPSLTYEQVEGGESLSREELMIFDIKGLLDGYIETDTFVSRYPDYIRPEDYERSGDGWRDLEDYIEANITSFDPKGYIKLVDTPDESKYQILSDHAEIEIDGVVSGERYAPVPAFTKDRLITVDIGTLYAGIEDGWGCGDPDPMGTITLQIADQDKQISFGPYENRSTVNVNKSIELIAPAGWTKGKLFIDLQEDDDWGCGGDDDLDINPLPNETNAMINLDFTYNGGISIAGVNDGYSLGSFNKPITLSAHPNKLNIKVNIEEFVPE